MRIDQPGSDGRVLRIQSTPQARDNTRLHEPASSSNKTCLVVCSRNDYSPLYGQAWHCPPFFCHCRDHTHYTYYISVFSQLSSAHPDLKPHHCQSATTGRPVDPHYATGRTFIRVIRVFLISLMRGYQHSKPYSKSYSHKLFLVRFTFPTLLQKKGESHVSRCFPKGRRSTGRGPNTPSILLSTLKCLTPSLQKDPSGLV